VSLLEYFSAKESAEESIKVATSSKYNMAKALNITNMTNTATPCEAACSECRNALLFIAMTLMWSSHGPIKQLRTRRNI
jgi:hypothetical protein